MFLRRHIVVLWRAFWHRATPFYLKSIMLGILIYLISPIDIIPDFLLGLGWIDDFLLVTLTANWIIKRLPQEVLESGSGQSSADGFTKSDNYSGQNYSEQNYSEQNYSTQNYSDPDDGPIIKGTSRRR